MTGRRKKAGKLSAPEIDQDWFRQTFAGDYPWLYAHRSDREAADQVRVAARLVPFRQGQKVLDIACGTGRHLLAFARIGARVTGVDLSPTLLAIARHKLSVRGAKALLLEGDMRRLPFRDEFDGATIWFTSFGYFPSVADDKKVLDGLAAGLKPGGWWWIDLANPIYLRRNLNPYSEREEAGPHGKAIVREERKIVGRRVIKRITIRDDLGRRTLAESVRLYRPEQFGSMISRTGLATEGILGDYQGGPLTRESPRQIWFGRKP